MREIKFRAWDEKSKAWLTCSQLTHITSTEGGSHQTDVLMMEPCEHLGEIAVEQFTGLLDKNGKEIYEGDFISRTSDINGKDFTSKYQVVWVQTRACFGLIPATPYEFTELTDERAASHEVIGNVHENGDLLKN